MSPKEDPGPQWIRIEDFSPGIYSASGTVVDATANRTPAAPLGSADPNNTWSCYSIPSGSLVALPGITQTYTWPDTSTNGYDHGAARPTYIVGLLIHDELGSYNTEAIVMAEFDDGSNHYWKAYSYILETAALNTIVGTTNVSAAGIFGSPYPQMSRAAAGLPITAVTVGATTTITTNSTLGANPFAPTTIGSAAGAPVSVYFNQLPVGVTGLTLNKAYTITASGGSSGAWTGTFATSPSTGGAWSSGGVAVVLQIPYSPVCVFPSGGPAQPAGSSGQLYMYPDPSNRSSFTPFTMMVNPGQSVTGQTLTHQSRIIVLAGTSYTWTNTTFSTNENLNYTDPPASAAIGNQQTVLAAEQPYGYGAGGSISAGELVLIKKRGGGVIVTGDIFSPTVTSLPGITSTGNFYGNAASTPVGFIYCSFDNGAWSWNGSNTSQKISSQLNNSFYLPPEYSSMQSNNYGYYAQEFGDKVYMSNNWMMDTKTGNWWTYYPRLAQGGHDLFWIQPVNGNYIYAGQLSFKGASSLDFLYRFDPSSPAQTFQWQSTPLHLAPVNQTVDVRQVIVRASCTQINNSITISVLDQGTVVAGPFTYNGITTGPELLRFNIGGIGLYEPSIRISSTNTAGVADMPIIHGIDIQYSISTHLASDN